VRSRLGWLWVPVAVLLWIPFLLVGLLGIVHALGHWLAARWLRIPVVFGLGTGFVLAEGDGWRLSGLPGAYAKPSGWRSRAKARSGRSASSARGPASSSTDLVREAAHDVASSTPLWVPMALLPISERSVNPPGRRPVR